MAIINQAQNQRQLPEDLSGDQPRCEQNNFEQVGGMG